MSLQSVKPLTLFALFLPMLIVSQASAAIALDRTRVILPGDKHSVSLSISNQNTSLPYLAQSWVEDAHGNKIESPLMAVPPLQRVEPSAKGQVKIQSGDKISVLPQDRESLFYFNVREIPPKSTKANTLQIALQTRVKLFYRPAALGSVQNSELQQLTLTRVGDNYQLNNPTPYYLTISAAMPTEKAPSVKSFRAVMAAPKGNVVLGGSVSALGNQPVLTLINDYGGSPKLKFSCSGSTCKITSITSG